MLAVAILSVLVALPGAALAAKQLCERRPHERVRERPERDASRPDARTAASADAPQTANVRMTLTANAERRVLRLTLSGLGQTSAQHSTRTIDQH